MNAEELISSGLLEAYTLGQASAEEVRLVERMRASDPHVANALLEVEESLEILANKRSRTPPERVRASLLNDLGAQDTSRVLPMPRGAFTEGWRMWLAAASVLILAGSIGSNILLYTKLNRVQDQLARYESERDVMAEQLQVQKASLDGTQEQLMVLLDPQRKVVTLAGLPLDPDGSARIYWDPVTHEVHMNVLSLPAPPEGKQYQLWALAGGVPIDAGVFDVVNGVQHMRSIPSAEAFAVTLEKAGGVPSPTLSAMYLMGSVS
jgi:anti-sigma-K factor RskA